MSVFTDFYGQNGLFTDDGADAVTEAREPAGRQPTVCLFLFLFFPLKKRKTGCFHTLFEARPRAATPCKNIRQDTMILSVQFTCGVAKNFLLGRFRRVLLNLYHFQITQNRIYRLLHNLYPQWEKVNPNTKNSVLNVD